MTDIKFVIRQRLKLMMQGAVLPAVYRIGCLRRVDPSLIVFADAHHNSRPTSMDRLVWELRRRESEGQMQSETRGNGRKLRVIERYHDYAGMSMLGQFFDAVSFMWLYAVAGAVVICDNYMPVAACKKRKKTKVVQVWHGPGLYKKFGYDTPDDIPSYYKKNVFRNYDLVTVSGKKCVPVFERAMRQPEGVVRAVGIARLDICRSEKYRKHCREEFEKIYPEAKGKKVILWAPTFRGNAGRPKLVGLEAMDRLRRELGDDWCVIYSVHPHLFTYYDREDLRGRMPTERLLPAVDVLITDFSSVMCDAAVMGRKMLLLAPDLHEFMENRGTYMKPEEFPGEIVTEADRLKDAVIRTYEDYDYGKQETFIRGYLDACDGHATERTLAYILPE